MDDMWIFIVVCITCVCPYRTVFAKCNITLNMLGYKEALCKYQGFTSVPMDLPPDIKKLDLSYNRLTRLDANGFHRYKYLEYLIIDNNDIRWLHTTAFCSLSLLRHLSLSRNYLNVSESYPHGVFESLNNLSVLDISRNMKTPGYNPYKIPVDGLSNLRELSIDLVLNATFGQHFKKLYNLQKLSLDYCLVNYLNNETFLEMPVSLKEFHMTTCKDFVVIEGGVLVPFPHLKVLNLTNSNIHLTQALNILHPFQNKTMDALLFRGITRPDSKHRIDPVILTPEMMKYTYTICIKTMDLSANNIILVKNKSLVLFQRPECFEAVMISANSFSVDSWEVDFVLFTFKMTNIKIIDFSYFPLGFKNPIFLNVITKDNFTRVEQVQGKWARQHNSMTVLLPSQLHFFRMTHMMAEGSFLEIKAKNSYLRHLEISYFETDFFPLITMEGFNCLDHLDLSGISSVKTIGEAKIPFLIHLKTLILKETNLINVLQTNTTILKFCPNIINLDISYNYIWKMKANSFGQLLNLQQLNLSHNLLETVPDVVTTFYSLDELDLSYNQLTTIGKNMLDWIDNMHKKHGTFKLYLSNNPLICSCDTTRFLRWISTTQVKLDKNGNYSCWVSSRKSINYTRNVAEDLHHYFVDCDTTVWIKLGISLLVSVLSSVLCIALLYNFRWRIMFFLFRNFRRFAEKGLELTFDYDVYISYSDDCVSFVKELQEKVEDEWGFKVCFEDRDFIVGESIATERAMSINRCRHIIFLVTPSIVQNEWTRFEIERAKYEKFSKNLQKIVVITRDIPLDIIPKEFSTIWKDVLLIQWPIEMDEVQMAWQKLRLWFF
ncbi:toll-like receptor 4 [Mytilus californianus]|uniref:toll-like receptor 4 n=1 Tax=Mytilus californianus TaxID=6549 RepID=UPI0022457C17|nr:toll-like receptor 4 [Mytilus californianus]